MSIEAMKQALEALGCIESSLHVWEINKIGRAMNALRQAIEFQEMVKKGTKAWADTPDDWVDDLRGGAEKPWVKTYAGGKPNYTAPIHASDMSQERVDETAKCGHEPVPNDYDRSIHSNPDAQAWAKFFMATVKEKEWCIDDIDEGLMLGWFANAMMAMYDHTIAINKQIDLTWVGFTAAELEKIIPMLVKSFINHDEKTLFLLVGAMLVDIEDQLKEKNGYGSEVYGPTTDFIGPSVVEAISKREWVGLTDEERHELNNFRGLMPFIHAIEAKLKEKNSL